MPDHWRAAVAREHFDELIEAAAQGFPQFIRVQDGREAVLVSMEQFRRIKPALKESTGPDSTPGDDPADNTYTEARGLFGGTSRPKK